MPDMNPDEQLAATFLQSHGLAAERFSKSERRHGKTPDFRVMRDGQLEFFCEVKTDDEDAEWIRKKQSAATVFEHMRNGKYILNRFTGQIGKAVQQFDAVNPDLAKPNVLIFVNHDGVALHEMLIGALTGNYYTDTHDILPWLKKYSEGGIAEAKKRIHLFVWIDRSEGSSEERFTFGWDDRFYVRLCDLFSVNQDQVNPFD